MNNLIEYAKFELEVINEKQEIKEIVMNLVKTFSEQEHSGMSAGIVRTWFIFLIKKEKNIPEYLFIKEGDFYGGILGEALEELIEVFKTKCNKCSKNKKLKILDYFNKLADFKPLTPLTFKNEEWMQLNNDELHYQNKRNFGVFKQGKQGRPYYVDAYYMKNQNGLTYTGSLSTSKGTIRKCYIKDAANMPEICLNTIDWEVNKDNESIKEPGSGYWLTKMKDEKQLKELEKYYDIEYLNENKK